MQMFTRIATALVVLTAISAGLAGQEAPLAQSPDNVWTFLSDDELELRKSGQAEPQVRPKRFQAAQLEPSALDVILAAVPMEFTPAAESAPVEMLLPTPDGRFERFAVVESPIMHPDLQRWLAGQGWPMRTYKGRSLEEVATTVRLDWGGPSGFHAMVYSPGGSYFVDPADADDRRRYVTYFKRDNPSTVALRCEGAELGGIGLGEPRRLTSKAGTSTNGHLRTYRTAVAVSGDYTAELASGSVAQAQANVVTIVNRVNQTYERELSVRLSLIANNTDVVYTNAATDPFTEASASTMLGENQANMNAVIGSANYDFGHVFYRGGSGIASLGSLCGANKARGVSGLWQATGDSIVVDMVAHEMGHQLGASHTFNSPLGFCTGGNYSPGTAWEPGSGTTIMSYSGICDADNVQSASDDYFHAGSLDQMLTFVGGAGACASTSSAGNANAPTVTAGGSYTIPANTPFELTVAGSNDADGDSLTYTWEQFDLGAAATLAAGDQGGNPIVRSLPPSANAERNVTGTRLGEMLPSTNRTLSFRVTARDNNAGGGRVGEDTVTLTSTTMAGPFELTAPNGSEEFPTGSTQTVTWNVAGTNGGAVNAANVDILLSTDSGQSFPTVLVSATPNDGSQSVTFPFISTAGARVKVRGSGNVFFDMSDADFSIGAFGQCRNPSLALSPGSTVSDDMTVTGHPEALSDLDVSLDIFHGWIGDLTVTLLHVDTGTSVVLVDEPGTPNFTYPSDVGCQEDEIDATLDDEAMVAAEDQCNASPPAMGGLVTPNNPLSAFTGESLNGTWRLSVQALWNWGGTRPEVVNEWCLKSQFPVVLPDDIFSDGFESGDMSKWSSSVP